MSKRTRRREATTNWHRGCTAKVRYHDREQAKAARRKCQELRPSTPLRIYECSHCSGFHLASTHVSLRKVSP